MIGSSDGPNGNRVLDFWDRLAQGNVKEVILPASAERKPTRTRIQRATPWSHYAAHEPGRDGRPRCRARGCKKWLRVDQPFACCTAHEEQVRQQLASLQRSVAKKA